MIWRVCSSISKQFLHFFFEKNHLRFVQYIGRYLQFNVEEGKLAYYWPIEDNVYGLLAPRRIWRFWLYTSPRYLIMGQHAAISNSHAGGAWIHHHPNLLSSDRLPCWVFTPAIQRQYLPPTCVELANNTW